MNRRALPVSYSLQKQGFPPYQQDRVAMGVAGSSNSSDMIARDFEDLIRRTNDEARESGMGDRGGTTASLIAVLPTGRFITVHTGDSPIFVYDGASGGQFRTNAVHAFTPHDVYNVRQIEALRCLRSDLRIDGRCLLGPGGGMISITNSIGDTRFGLLCEPEVRQFDLRQDGPSVIVVASDGILENGAGQATYEPHVNRGMIGYRAPRSTDSAEPIARSILAEPAGHDNCTVFVAIYDPACIYEQIMVVGLFDGHFTDEVAELAVAAFRFRYSSSGQRP